MVMQTVEELLQAARRLSDGERRRLIEALQGGMREEPFGTPRREAVSSWVKLAGRFHSDFPDVSTDKYRHLGDAYADKR